MSTEEIIALFLGGGLIWKLRFFATPGPIIALTSRNVVSGNDEYPRVLEIENFGDKAAQSIEWEIREYFTAVLPRYESRRDRRPAPLKPGERFGINVGSESADVAFLSKFEIFMTYKGPNRASFYSHFTVDGDVRRNDSGLNQARWRLTCSFLRLWVREFCNNLLIRARTRPVQYSLHGAEKT